eukprot:7970437-Pyramimonas_sp.AAC.1
MSASENLGADLISPVLQGLVKGLMAVWSPSAPRPRAPPLHPSPPPPPPPRPPPPPPPPPPPSSCPSAPSWPAPGPSRRSPPPPPPSPRSPAPPWPAPADRMFARRTNQTQEAR